MANFNDAVNLTLKNEGGYVDSSVDPGHATNMGITQADMPGQDMHTLTVEQATNYYRENYWKPLYSEITDQSVADKLFDMGVLFGIGEAVKILQQTLGIQDDGVFGPLTLADTNGADIPSLLQSYKTRMVSRALEIATEKPVLRKFVTGWIRRINS